MCVCARARARVRACVRACTHVGEDLCKYDCVHAQVCACIREHTCTSTCVYRKPGKKATAMEDVCDRLLNNG